MKKYRKKIYKREDGNITFVKDEGTITMDDHHAKALNDQFENSLILYVPINDEGEEDYEALENLLNPPTFPGEEVIKQSKKEMKEAKDAKPSVWDRLKNSFKK